MKDILSIKLWTERKMRSRSKWGSNYYWEHQYSMSWGNRDGWLESRKRLGRSQKRMSMVYELQK